MCYVPELVCLDFPWYVGDVRSCVCVIFSPVVGDAGFCAALCSSRGYVMSEFYCVYEFSYVE